MPSYDYDIEDFTNLGSNDVDIQQLHYEVEQESFGASLLWIHRHHWSQDVDFMFSGSLSGAEQTTLGNVVANHTGAGLNVEGVATPDSEGESTTTSGSFQTKLAYSAGVMNPDIPYRIGWYCEVNNSSTSGRTEIQVDYDGNVIALPSIESEDTSDWVPFSGFFYLDAGTEVSTITIKYRRLSSGTAKIRRARLELTKVD